MAKVIGIVKVENHHLVALHPEVSGITEVKFPPIWGKVLTLLPPGVNSLSVNTKRVAALLPPPFSPATDTKLII